MSNGAGESTSYTFPGATPYQHQRTTVDLLVRHPRFQVFAGIGTGKTFTACWALDYLMRRGEVRHALIVAPLSTLEVVWQRTLFRVNSQLPVTVLKGTAVQRNKKLFEAVHYHENSVSIINPDALHIIADDLNTDQLDLVIVDESAMFRNSKSRRYKALCQIVGDYYEEREGTSFGAPIKRRIKVHWRTDRNWRRRFWPMTGSPAPETPCDPWPIAKLVCPERVPKHFGEMRDLTMIRVSQFKWEPRHDAEKIVSEMLRGFTVRYDRDECFDLPPTVTHTHDVALTKEQETLIRTLRKEAAVELELGLIKGVNEAVIRSKVLQITSGAVRGVDVEGKDYIQPVDCSPKFQALDELVESSSGPVIVYADFIGAIARIVMYAESRGITNRFIVGDTKNRLQIFDDVQRGKVKLLIAHPKTIAHGIDLTTSNVIAWWNPIDSHEIYDQASGRITRPTQKRKTLIVHFVSSALERAVLRKLNNKQKMQGTLLDYLKQDEL